MANDDKTGEKISKEDAKQVDRAAFEKKVKDGTYKAPSGKK